MVLTMFCRCYAHGCGLDMYYEAPLICTGTHQTSLCGSVERRCVLGCRQDPIANLELLDAGMSAHVTAYVSLVGLWWGK